MDQGRSIHKLLSLIVLFVLIFAGFWIIGFTLKFALFAMPEIPQIDNPNNYLDVLFLSIASVGLLLFALTGVFRRARGIRK